MKAQESQIKFNMNEIEFNPENNTEIQDVSLNLKNLEIDEEEVLNDDTFDDEYEQFPNEEEYQSIFKENLNVKKSNKETFLDSYFLTFKSPRKKKLKNSFHLKLIALKIIKKLV